MKKVFLALVAILILFPAISQKPQSDVSTDISNFDVNQHEFSLNTQSQRSWWQNVLSVCAVTGADILGAYAGCQAASGAIAYVGLATGGTGAVVVAGITGVVCGAGASYAAYTQLPHRQASPASIGFGNLNIELPTNFANLIQYGKYHNQVMHNNFYNSNDLNTFYQPLLNEQQINFIQSPEINTKFDYIKELGTSYANNNFNFDEMADKLIERRLMNDIDKKILMAFYIKYKSCSSDKDMENLINFAIRQVNNSTLLQTQKLSLITAFMVASESPFYFNNK